MFVGILLTNFKARVNHGGNISSLFNINYREARQGDPIVSPLLFYQLKYYALNIYDLSVQ